MGKPGLDTSGSKHKQEKDRLIRDTADVVAVIRFRENQKEAPLVSDPFAHLFVSPAGEALLESALERWPFFSEYLVVRAKLFDETLRDLCVDEGANQVVILGAGNDMRAARLPFLRDKRIFEVDYPDRIACKKDVLRKTLKELPNNTVYLGADIRHDSIIERLDGAGFTPGERSVFILEGLIYYLGQAGVDFLFSGLSGLPSTGTVFLIDHISRDMSPQAQDPGKRGTPPYPEDPLVYLNQHGFSIRESVLLGDLTERYFGRCYQERWWAITCER